MVEPRCAYRRKSDWGAPLFMPCGAPIEEGPCREVGTEFNIACGMSPATNPLSYATIHEGVYPAHDYDGLVCTSGHPVEVSDD